MVDNLFNYKSEWTPEVYWIASLKSGQTLFADNKPGLTSSWRRLREYLQETSDFITRIRIQTPHQLIDCGEGPYKALYHINKFSVAFHEPDRQDLNGNTLVWATTNDLNQWDVHTIFSPEEFRHVGFHKAFTREYLPPNATEKQRLESISLNDIGIIINPLPHA